MTNSDTKNFSQNVSSSYHLEDRGKCNKNTCTNTCNVPKLRFKGYNDEWKKVRTEEIFENVTIKNKPSLPVLAVTQERGTILRESCGINIKYENESLKSYKLVKPGNFIISLRSFQGGLEYSGLEGIVSPAYTILNNKQSISYDFFKYYFKTYNFIKSLNIAVEGIRDGKQISYNSFKDIKITFPNIEEQEKIASFLTLIDKKIEKQKELVELLKKYKRGLLSAIFSQKLRFKDDNGNDYPAWEEKRLGNICKTFSGGTPSVTNSEYYNGEIPFIKSGEIHSDRTEMFITVEGLENSSAKLVNKGDLLYALYGATSGEVDISKIDGAINQAILCVKSDTLVLNYLKELLSYNKNRILCKYLQGGQGNLSADIFKALKFYFPIKEEQNKISDLLISYDKTIKIEEHLLNYYVSYKQGLLQQLFI